MTEVKPTFVRYSTVRNVLAKEPGLAAFMQPEDVVIPHRDGVTTLKISAAVKEFTELVCKRGLDPAVGLPRSDLVAAAVAHFKLTPQPQEAAGVVPVAATDAGVTVVGPSKGAQPPQLSKSLAVLVLLTSAVSLSKDDRDPGSEERLQLLAAVHEKYRKLHGL